VAAAGRTPHKIAGTAHPFVTIQRSLEHQGLLDENVLVIRQPCSRRHFRQHRQQAGGGIGHQRLRLDSRMASLLPGQRSDLHKARCQRRKGGVIGGIRRDGAHAHFS
jgi:hypothetical protein